jgi:hypothetical protein
MFASLSKGFSQLSPKTLLANYLSQQLAEFFNVDATQIEANLVTDAHVKLQNVEIRPYVLETGGSAEDASDFPVVIVEGRVESIEFRWEWGTGFGQGAHAYITDVQLHVKGAKLRASQSKHGPPPGQSTTSPATPEPAAPTDDPDWKANYLQQIVDHLRLILDSVEISIELPGNGGSPSIIIVRGEQMELLTLSSGSTKNTGGEMDNGLCQRLSLGALSAVLCQSTGEKLPLLDPVGYRAIVKRTSGRRFLDGIGAGLVITGERILAGGGGASDPPFPAAAANALQFHAGVAQVSALLEAQKMLGFVDRSSDDTLVVVPGSLGTPDENKSSLFVLPVEYLSLVLPNGTHLRIDQCVVTLRTDASVCRVECPKGTLLVDGESVNYTETASWQVDLLQYLIRVERREASVKDDVEPTFHDASQSEEALIQLELRVDQCRKIYHGFNDLMPLFDDPNPGEPVTPWTFRAAGTATVKLVSSSQKSALLDLNEPWFQYIGTEEESRDGLRGLPCLLSWESARIRAVDLGNLAMVLPKLTTGKNGLSMSFQGSISVSIESLEHGKAVQKFVNDFADILEGESTGLPVEVTIPSICGGITQEGIELEIKGAVASGFEISVDSSTLRSEQGRLSLGKASLDLASYLVTVDEVASAEVNETFRLAGPLRNLRILYDQDRLSIDTGHAKLAVPASIPNSSPTRGFHCEALWNSHLPISMDLSMEALSVFGEDLSTELLFVKSISAKACVLDSRESLVVAWESLRSQGIEALKGSARVVRRPEVLDASLACSSICVSGLGGVDAAVEGVKLCGQLERARSTEKSFELEGVGFLTHASFRISNISSFSFPSLCQLTSAIGEASMAFKDGSITMHTGAVNMLVLKPESVSSSVESKDTLRQYKLPFPVTFSVPAVVVHLEALPARSVRVDTLSIDASPTTDGGSLELNCSSLVFGELSAKDIATEANLDGSRLRASASCQHFRASGFWGVDADLRTTQLSLILDTSASSAAAEGFFVEGAGSLLEVSASVSEILSLSLDGSGSLGHPLTDTGLLFHKGVLEMGVSPLHWRLPNASAASNATTDMRSTIKSVRLPCPISLNLPSLHVYESQRIDSFLRFDDVVFDGRTVAPVTSGKLSWGASDLQGIELGSSSIEMILEGAQLKVSGECTTLRVHEKSGIDMSASAIAASATLEVVSPSISVGIPIDAIGQISEASVWVGEVRSLSVSEMGCLSAPLVDSKLLFKNGTAEAKIGHCVWKGSAQHVGNSSHPQMPSLVAYDPFFRFPFELSMESVRYSMDGQSPVFGCGSIQLQTGRMQNSSSWLPLTSTSVEDFFYLEIVKVPKIAFRAWLNMSQPAVLHRLELTLTTPRLSADFNSVKWSDALTQSVEKSPAVPLPHAEVRPFDLILSWKGTVISVQDSVLHCHAFKGTETTDSDGVANHFIRVVKKRIPYLLTKSDVLGVNVGDSVGMVFARTAMQSSVVGSVIGIGARDAVGGAISSGKQSRGAAETEKYQFGDLSRGIAASVGAAANNPVAAAGATAEYTSKNRERLGGAAGTGAGMIVGAAIAGPIGMIAVSFIGSMAGRRAVNATCGEYSTNPEEVDDGSLAQQIVQIDNQAQQPPDFLSGPTQQPSVDNAASSVRHYESAAYSGQQHQPIRDAQGNDPFAIFETQTDRASFQREHENNSFARVAEERQGGPTRGVPQQAGHVDRLALAMDASNEQAGAKALDPLSVFAAAPVSTPSPQSYAAPPDDLLSFFTSQEASTTPTPATVNPQPLRQQPARTSDQQQYGASSHVPSVYQHTAPMEYPSQHVQQGHCNATQTPQARAMPPTSAGHRTAPPSMGQQPSHGAPVNTNQAQGGYKFGDVSEARTIRSVANIIAHLVRTLTCHAAHPRRDRSGQAKERKRRRYIQIRRRKLMKTTGSPSININLTDAPIFSAVHSRIIQVTSFNLPFGSRV